jgi:hypothetical protein
MTLLPRTSFSVSFAVALCQLLGTGSAAAQVQRGEVDDSGPTQTASEARDKSVRLERSPGLSFGLGAYGGIAVQTTAEGSGSHAIMGALSRVRYRYFELGAVLELSDKADDRWRSLGGFAGAWLPFRHWVDLEFAVGAASRRYLSKDARFGPGGYDVGIPALTLRAGLSDRSSDGALGARLGCDLVAAFDLARKSVPWRYVVEGEGDQATRIFTGRSRIGGFSIGLVLTAAFDAAVVRRREL